MRDKETIEILTTFLTKYPLTEQEKEAVREAIGILSWTKLIEGRVSSLKKSRDAKMLDLENPPTSFE